MFKLIKDQEEKLYMLSMSGILIFLTVSKGSGSCLAGSGNTWCKYFVRVKQQDDR